MSAITPTRAELEQHWAAVRQYWQQHLARHGVPERNAQLGTPPGCADLCLIYLHIHFGIAVEKDAMATWISNINNTCGMDAQHARHLRRDDGWPIHSANKKETDALGTRLTTKPYQYCLYGTSPSPEFLIRRTRERGIQSASTFEEMVLHYDNKCGMCGKTSPLQQGHMNPHQPLVIPSNCIPLCQECNLYQRDRFVINAQGRIVTILPEPRNSALVANLSAQQKRALKHILFPTA